MNDDEIDGVMANISALAMALTAVISALPADVAGAAALELRAALDVQREQEQQDQMTPPQFAQTRDQLAEAFLGLLAAASRR